MSTQLETEGPKKRRRKNTPDALEDQYPTPKVQDEDIHQELATFTARLDAAAASFLYFVFTELDHNAYSLKSTLTHSFTDLDGRIKDTRLELEYASGISMNGCQDPSAFLQREIPVVMWGNFDALSRTALFRNSDQPSNSKTMIVMRNTVSDIESSARMIPKILAEAVARKPLDPLVERLIRRRWNRIETWLDTYYHETARSRRKGVPTWSVLAKIIESKTITSERSSLTRLNRISSSLWLCFLAFLVTIPTTAQAFRYSLHQPGTPRDADFWLQIRNSCMTILNLATLAIPIWRTKALPATMSFWIWGLLISVSLGVGIAPVVYVFGPTEWSFLMSIVAGIVQTFITLQIALVADTAASAGVKSAKED